MKTWPCIKRKSGHILSTSSLSKQLVTGLLALLLTIGISGYAMAQDDKDTLRSVSLLYRHGVISPKYAPPKNATEWPMGFSQLTAVGMRGMYDQGAELRKRYIDDLGLLSPSYHVSELHVRASNTDRALQSAQMLILGLYPLGSGPDPSAYDTELTAAPSAELSFTPVPVHSVALENDAVMRPWTGRADCKRYRTYVKRLGATELYDNQGKQHEEFIRRVSSVMGVNEGEKIGKALFLINEVYEPLSANLQHNLPLPEGISVEDMQKMSELADWNYHHQFQGPSVGRLTGGSFVAEVIQNFSRVTKDEGKKLYLYAGHQRTMLGVEAALGIETARTSGPLYAGRVPPLASHYAFELHETNKDNYAVKLKFRSGDTEQTIQIPGCDGELCPLDSFVSAVSEVIPQNWRNECNG